jgi:hypothetical protein
VDALGADLAGFLGIECTIAETLPEHICALVYAKLKSFANSIGLPFRYAPPCLLLADMSWASYARCGSKEEGGASTSSAFR